VGVVFEAPQVGWFDVPGVVAVEQEVEEAHQVPIGLVLEAPAVVAR